MANFRRIFERFCLGFNGSPQLNSNATYTVKWVTYYNEINRVFGDEAKLVSILHESF
jgi:hypothetical protein